MGVTFIWPTDTKRVTSEFRPPHRPDHKGIDIADPGTRPIFATAAGEVYLAREYGTYGNAVFIRHSINGESWVSVYAHLRDNLLVNPGDRVKQGQRIATMGNTGNSTGQHLHFELIRGTEWSRDRDVVDPLDVLEKDLSPKSKGEYELNNSVDGYYTAADAKSRQDKRTTVQPGSYFIYSDHEGMLNVTTKVGVAGSWINPADNKTESEVIYTVERGDSLSALADRFKTTVDKLVSDNNIKDKSLIYPGQKLKINGAVEKQYYKVQPGESLSIIAAKYHITLDEVKALNPDVKGPDYIIYAKQQIRVK